MKKNIWIAACLASTIAACDLSGGYEVYNGSAVTTYIQGVVVNSKNNQPLGNVSFGLKAYSYNMRVENETGLDFPVDSAGRFNIAFLTAPDSNYAFYLKNAPNWYQQDLLSNYDAFGGSRSFDRGAAQIRSLRVCPAAFVDIKTSNANQVAFDSVEVKTYYEDCVGSFIIGRFPKMSKTAFNSFAFTLPMPANRRPIMTWTTYQGGALVTVKNDTLSLGNQGDTTFYRINF